MYPTLSSYHNESDILSEVIENQIDSKYKPTWLKRQDFTNSEIIENIPLDNPVIERLSIRLKK